MFKSIQEKLINNSDLDLVNQLHKIPIKDKNKQIPKYKNGGAEPNQVYSSDLLFMPSDRGYKYLLVLVDVITGITQAEPLKTKSTKAVLNAFKKIFVKMPIPSILQVDPGTEFKGIVSKYFKDNHVLIRVGDVGRSRQQAMAEQRNNIIAKALFQKQTIQELQKHKTVTKWIDDIKKVIDAINEYETIKYEKNKLNGTLPYIPLDTIIYEIGTKVRTQLDKPESILGYKLHGKFRATDIRWNPTISTITNVIITPNQPILYNVDGLSTGYTFNQLQQPITDKPPHISTKQKIKTNMKFTRHVEKLDQLIPKIINNI